MPFSYPADQKRIWNAFSIPERSELLQNSSSVLYGLMQDIDAFDLENSTTIASNAVELLVKLDEIDVKISTLNQDSARNVTRWESHLEGSVEFSGKTELSLLTQQKLDLIQQLKRLIDPCGCFVQRYGFAEVIPT